MLAELRLQDRGQQFRAGTSARDRVERRRSLADRLTGPAAEPLAHGLDHLPLPRHHLQGLGDVLAKLGQRAAAARTNNRSGNDYALARQMRRQWSTHRFAAYRTRAGTFGGL